MVVGRVSCSGDDQDGLERALATGFASPFIYKRSKWYSASLSFHLVSLAGGG